MNCPHCGGKVAYPELPLNYCDRCGKQLTAFDLRLPRRGLLVRLLANNTLVVVLVIVFWLFIFKLLRFY